MNFLSPLMDRGQRVLTSNRVVKASRVLRSGQAALNPTTPGTDVTARINQALGDIWAAGGGELEVDVGINSNTVIRADDIPLAVGLRVTGGGFLQNGTRAGKPTITNYNPTGNNGEEPKDKNIYVIGLPGRKSVYDGGSLQASGSVSQLLPIGTIFPDGWPADLQQLALTTGMVQMGIVWFGVDGYFEKDLWSHDSASFGRCWSNCKSGWVIRPMVSIGHPWDSGDGSQSNDPYHFMARCQDFTLVHVDGEGTDNFFAFMDEGYAGNIQDIIFEGGRQRFSQSGIMIAAAAQTGTRFCKVRRIKFNGTRFACSTKLLEIQDVDPTNTAGDTDTIQLNNCSLDRIENAGGYYALGNCSPGKDSWISLRGSAGNVLIRGLNVPDMDEIAPTSRPFCRIKSARIGRLLLDVNYGAGGVSTQFGPKPFDAPEYVRLEDGSVVENLDFGNTNISRWQNMKPGGVVVHAVKGRIGRVNGTVTTTRRGTFLKVDAGAEVGPVDVDYHADKYAYGSAFADLGAGVVIPRMNVGSYDGPTDGSGFPLIVGPGTVTLKRGAAFLSNGACDGGPAYDLMLSDRPFDADGTDAASHTLDVSPAAGPWTQNGTTASVKIKVNKAGDGGHFEFTGSTASYHRAAEVVRESTSSDGVGAVMGEMGGDAAFGVAFRSRDADNEWKAGVNSATQTLDIVKVVGGIETVVANPAVVVTSGGAGLPQQSYVVFVVLDGPQITVILDGSGVSATVTDPTFSGETKHGIFMVCALGDKVPTRNFTFTSPPVPRAPTGVTMTATASGQYAVGWHAQGGVTMEWYEGTATGAESGTPQATGLTGTSYLRTGATDGVHYYGYLKAVSVATARKSAASAEANLILTPPFTPASIASLQLWHGKEADYQDLAGTTPVTVGSPVALRKSRKSGLPDWNQATSGLRPTAGTVTAGVHYDNGVPGRFVRGTGVAFTGKFTAVFTGRMILSVQPYIPFAGSGTANGLIALWYDGNAYVALDNTTFTFVSVPYTVPRNVPVRCKVWRDVGNQCWIKGTGMAKTAIGAPLAGTITLNTEGLGAGAVANIDSNGEHDLKLLYSDDLEATGEDVALDAWLTANGYPAY